MILCDTMINMNDKLKQQFEEQLAYLPDITQQALKSFDWATGILSIGKKHGLYIDQLEDLQIETMLVLVGLVQPEDYPKELMNRLALSPAETDKIIDDINDEIFTPIHNYIIESENKTPKIPTELTTPQPISFGSPLDQAGMKQTFDDAPTPTPTVPLSRVGGTNTYGATIPETRPIQFNPTVTTTPVSNAPVPLSMDKLKNLYQRRQQIVDTTLGKE
jgi:hypothetical protein